MARERKSFKTKRKGQERLLGISNKFSRAADKRKNRKSHLKSTLAVDLVKDLATTSQGRGSPSLQTSLAKRRTMLLGRKSCLSSTPASALKRKHKRLSTTRQKDKNLRDRMFLRNDTHPSSTGIDNDCILIERVTEVIILDDDDEDAKHAQQSISCSKGGTNVQHTQNQHNTSSSKEDTLTAREHVARVFGVDAEPAKLDKENRDLMKSNVAEESKSSRTENKSDASEKDDSSSVMEIMSSNQNTIGNTSYVDNSKPEAPDNAQQSLVEVPNEDLFFEDTTGNCVIDRKEIPVYENSFTCDIFKRAALSTNDVVFVSSTPIARIKKKKKRKQPVQDDSVIFISEEPAPSTLEDILSLNVHSPHKKSPLQPQQQPNTNRQGKKRRKGSLPADVTPPPKKQKNVNELFTASERKRIAAYNSNTYNPDKVDLPPGKRMVIIDGSNVAYGHSCNKEFSVKGIEIAIAYFEKMGHEVKAVIPQHRLQKSKSTDPEKLEKLHREGKIVFTPCKKLPGMCSTSYDDRFILQLAAEFDAAIVSNDNYRDILLENAAFKKIIEGRVIGYTWCNDLFMLPKDPYGRYGPSLSVILNRV